MLLTSIQAEYIEQTPDELGMYEQIEQAGRTCYKSEDKTIYGNDGRSVTAAQFANKLINVYKHQSVAEHGAIYLTVKPNSVPNFDKVCDLMDRFQHDVKIAAYSRVVTCPELNGPAFYISTNARVIEEHGLAEVIAPFITPPTQYHVRRHTVRLFTDRGVTAEANRHRVHSPSERSTRYVDYSEGGKLHGCRFVLPEELTGCTCSYNDNDITDTDDKTFRLMCADLANNNDLMTVFDTFMFAMLACEYSYNRLRALGWKPQQARRVLPLATESEIVISAFEDDWVRFFGMRYFGSTGTPHPDMKLSCFKIMQQFVKAGYSDPVRRACEEAGVKFTELFV